MTGDEPTRRERLEALRDRLTEDSYSTRGQGLAAVARELRAVIEELESLTDGSEESAVDDLAAKRAARRADAAG